MRGTYRSKLRKGPKRQRKRTVKVKSHCRSSPATRFMRRERQNRSMPF